MADNTIAPILEIFEQARNASIAAPMKAYMKNKFDYFGIKAPQRRELSKPILTSCKSLTRNETVDLAKKLWNEPQRELHYLAMELLLQNFKKSLEKKDITWLEWFITHNSWWDSVDVIAPKLIHSYFQKFPEARDQKVAAWIQSKNIWLIRSAILFQLKHKETTDHKFLFDLILRVSQTKEFFIDKAIGWVLRENAKTTPNLIRKFLDDHRKSLSPLSIREASKHL